MVLSLGVMRYGPDAFTIVNCESYECKGRARLCSEMVARNKARRDGRDNLHAREFCINNNYLLCYLGD